MCVASPSKQPGNNRNSPYVLQQSESGVNFACFSLLDLIFLCCFFKDLLQAVSCKQTMQQMNLKWDPPKSMNSLPPWVLLLVFTHSPFLLLCVDSNSRKSFFSQENTQCWSRQKTSASPAEWLWTVFLRLVCFFEYSGEFSLSDPDVHGSSLARCS